MKLARCLPNRHGVTDSQFSMSACDRALDVLDEASEGRRIVPILGHLVDHPLPTLSAKATLVVGRRVQSVAWAKRFLSKDRNPRDRANAIEALWGVDNSEAVGMMLDHTADKNNRVTGNAVFGLHVLGVPGAEIRAVQMARRNEPDFRWTSAWLMAQFKRQEDIEVLKRMIKDENPGVRRAALKALVGIRQEQVRKEAEEAASAPKEGHNAEEPQPEPSPMMMSGSGSMGGHFRSASAEGMMRRG